MAWAPGTGGSPPGSPPPGALGGLATGAAAPPLVLAAAAAAAGEPPVLDAVLAGAACLSCIFTSARIGSPLGRKSWKATVSDVQAALNVSTEPQRKVRNGGTERAPPAVRPLGTSIIWK